MEMRDFRNYLDALLGSGYLDTWLSALSSFMALLKNLIAEVSFSERQFSRADEVWNKWVGPIIEALYGQIDLVADILKTLEADSAVIDQWRKLLKRLIAEYEFSEAKIWAEVVEYALLGRLLR